MNRTHLTKTLLLLFLAPSISYAFFCPTNFNQIDFGASTDQVKQQCGKPDKEEEKEQDAFVPQEWNYFVTQTILPGTNPDAPGTLKTTVAFDKEGKAINISVNGAGVGSTQICGTTAIALGDTTDKIKSACGDPKYINKQQPSGEPVPAKKIVTYIYNSTPPQKLIFTDGILTSKE